MAVAGPRKHPVIEQRAHDYLYDSVFIVSGARDYARTVFKAAMGSAQPVIQPVWRTMFSELRQFPRMRVVLHPNCRLPTHLDRSYHAYVARVEYNKNVPTPDLVGKEQFKFTTYPKKQLAPVSNATPDFHPPSPHCAAGHGKPKSKGTQSIYRESSAQTHPWQPDGKPPGGLMDNQNLEILTLGKLQWGPGDPYRTGDLPADFHTTEIINKMRHARAWSEFVENEKIPRWMKKRDDIIRDIETKDWIFREAEIDELQEIRLNLLHKLQNEQRRDQSNKSSLRLARRWAAKKKEMEHKIDYIRKSRDRELRKLTAMHQSGGRLGQVQRMRASRGMGKVTKAVFDPTSDVYAPVTRHGIQARLRHADIYYDPSLLMIEDHAAIAAVPPWLERCGDNLKKSCSGHPLPLDPQVLCERETKWSEKFLEKMHHDLIKARLGAAQTSSVGPLHVLKPRRLQDTPRPATPTVDAVTEEDERCHQSALLLQRIIRGRAVQCLMYEGRRRAAELTEELKTTHGLQKEDKIRIAQEEAKARDYNALRNENEQKEDAITALVEELCGGAVSAALDFLEKELRRLKEERRQHAFILIALREKQMREAAEAGRRQKEEQRRREHDEMFKQVLGVTQETVEAYLMTMIDEGVEDGAEVEAVSRAEQQADKIDDQNKESANMSTAETNELVAELVHQFLLPDAHKAAARLLIQQKQKSRLEAARRAIFGLIEQAEIKPPSTCIRCGTPLDELCRCKKCHSTAARETVARDDWRWKMDRRREKKPEKTYEQRFPPDHQFRCMVNELVDKVPEISRKQKEDVAQLRYDLDKELRETVARETEVKGLVDFAIDVATGAYQLPVKKSDYYHTMRYIREGAIERTEPFVRKRPCPEMLPSEARRIKDEAEAAVDPYCKCDVDDDDSKKIAFIDPLADLSEVKHLLPTEIRELEDLRKCKCDSPETDSHDSRDSQFDLASDFSAAASERTCEGEEDTKTEASVNTGRSVDTEQQD